jgi:hypothetical protein
MAVPVAPLRRGPHRVAVVVLPVVAVVAAVQRLTAKQWTSMATAIAKPLRRRARGSVERSRQCSNRRSTLCGHRLIPDLNSIIAAFAAADPPVWQQLDREEWYRAARCSHGLDRSFGVLPVRFRVPDFAVRQRLARRSLYVWHESNRDPSPVLVLRFFTDKPVRVEGKVDGAERTLSCWPAGS